MEPPFALTTQIVATFLGHEGNSELAASARVHRSCPLHHLSINANAFCLSRYEYEYMPRKTRASTASAVLTPCVCFGESRPVHASTRARDGRHDALSREDSLIDPPRAQGRIMGRTPVCGALCGFQHRLPVMACEYINCIRHSNVVHEL